MPAQLGAFTVGVVTLQDIDIFSIGNEIQLAGVIYAGRHQVFLLPFADENFDLGSPLRILRLNDADMQKFLHQSDVLETMAGVGKKALLRKSQRQIDQAIAWSVYRRDGYACRYCGRADVPLTVDHIDLWEDGGATIEPNLVSACRRCNKTRGNKSFGEWLASADYLSFSANLTREQQQANLDLLNTLPALLNQRAKTRSR